jgi:flotillin
MAYVISGPKKSRRVLVGKAGIKIPFIERLDKVNLAVMQFDVKTSQPVPTEEFIDVKVDSNVMARIMDTPEGLELACKNFLNTPEDEIVSKITALLEGNVREIVGSMKLVDMVKDRKALSAKVEENVRPDLAKLGIHLETFNVQNIKDENGVIENLGVDNVERIRKDAQIAKSDAQKEVAIAEAANSKIANDAQVKAATEIAEAQAQLDKKQAALKKEVDTQLAQAEAAQDIEAENQRKLREVAAVEADIARAARATELKQKEIELKEYELDAIVRKQADADKYAAEQKAAADLIRRQRDAEAKAYEIKQQAEALRAQADADKYAAEQKAAGIAAIGLAEAEAIEKKAEAQKKMTDVSVIEMTMNALPQIVANAAAPLANVDKITMYGDGCSTKLVEDVMKTTSQVMEGVKESTGLDIASLVAGFLGGKSATDNQ